MAVAGCGVQDEDGTTKGGQCTSERPQRRSAATSHERVWRSPTRLVIDAGCDGNAAASDVVAPRPVALRALALAARTASGCLTGAGHIGDGCSPERPLAQAGGTGVAASAACITGSGAARPSRGAGIRAGIAILGGACSTGCGAYGHRASAPGTNVRGGVGGTGVAGRAGGMGPLADAGSRSRYRRSARHKHKGQRRGLRSRKNGAGQDPRGFPIKRVGVRYLDSASTLVERGRRPPGSSPSGIRGETKR